jgi:hypothetical protein
MTPKRPRTPCSELRFFARVFWCDEIAGRTNSGTVAPTHLGLTADVGLASRHGIAACCPIGLGGAKVVSLKNLKDVTAERLDSDEGAARVCLSRCGNLLKNCRETCTVSKDGCSLS